MKSILCTFFLLVLVASTSLAAVAVGFYNDPKNPGKCTIKDDLVLSPGQEIKNPDGCGRIICGDKGFAEFQSCGTQRIEGCKLGDYLDESLPYPECCKRKIICD